MKKAIIIGASKGIGRAISVQLSKIGYEVGLASRDVERLKALNEQLPNKSFFTEMDIVNTNDSIIRLERLIEKMGWVDVIIINAGIGRQNPSLQDELDILSTNVTGFLALARFAYDYFKAQGGGTLLAISSIAGLKGNRIGTAYSASKAFVSNYLEGLSYKSRKENSGIKVINIIPGFVDTDMTKGLKYKFWVATPEKIARQIVRSVDKNKKVVYVSRRWQVVAIILKILPSSIYQFI